ncbi:MAG TPA: transposase [Isosphaeraceae bacterium]|jgi:type I restriction enzyme R subunit|nr:transposase [Isosphaeraceae bacterium]
MFEFFDPMAEVRITAGNLPHWYQPGATYFITFRTADSIPDSVASSWRVRRNDWLRRHGIKPDDPVGGTSLLNLPERQRREYHETFSREYLDHLDRGHGACVLKSPGIAGIVAESLLHSDQVSYLLGDFVVMPNHVHLLVRPLGDADLLALCRSWKQFTANRINRSLGRRGRFWQAESFDHLVRGPDEFDRFRRYIADNPAKANLRAGEFLYHRRPDS